MDRARALHHGPVPGRIDWRPGSHVRDDVMPALLATDGCIGLSMLVNRESGRCIATSAWQSEEAMHATEDDNVVVVDGVESVVGTPEVEEWEIAVLHRDHTSGPGAWVRTTWVHVEPEQTDRLADLTGWCCSRRSWSSKGSAVRAC